MLEDAAQIKFYLPVQSKSAMVKRRRSSGSPDLRAPCNLMTNGNLSDGLLPRSFALDTAEVE
jgi:hypothetical protein